MDDEISKLKFAKTISGKFSNFEQAQNKPSCFAHINIYFRPLDWSILQGPWFYSEQSYDYDPWKPYKQGLHKLKLKDGIFIIENYKFKCPQRIAGAGFKPELLNSLSRNDFSLKVGCSMHFKERVPDHYTGKVEKGQCCLVNWEGRVTYLKSKVEINSVQWVSLDEGFDKITDKRIWGSDHGPIYFKRLLSFNEQLSLSWLREF